MEDSRSIGKSRTIKMESSITKKKREKKKKEFRQRKDGDQM
jgi:hypothetical protein